MIERRMTVAVKNEDIKIKATANAFGTRTQIVTRVRFKNCHTQPQPHTPLDMSAWLVAL